MVGLVLVSHSKKVAEGVKELAAQMAPDVPIAAAGGTMDGRLGTDAALVLSAIKSVCSEDGVLILFDLGSAFMNAEMAVEMLEEDMRSRVIIIDAAMVEGAIVAAIQCSLSKTLPEIKEALKDYAIGKMPGC